ncbi:MAG: SPOR domain-containing protein [Ignavibacteriaceae bacterium]|nr:SPOR domain-containing protein [Ignavibacteriaceae bacterium]
MKIIAGLIFSCAVLVLLPSCSSKEVTKDNTPKKDSVYVFDQVSPDTVKKIEPPVVSQNNSIPGYVIQIGAFSSRDKAESFSDIAKKKLNYDITIKYNDMIKLFLVQLNPPFTSKPEAEKVRDEIKQNQDYHDAWIVTVDK